MSLGLRGLAPASLVAPAPSSSKAAPLLLLVSGWSVKYRLGDHVLGRWYLRGLRLVVSLLLVGVATSPASTSSSLLLRVGRIASRGCCGGFHPQAYQVLFVLLEELSVEHIRPTYRSRPEVFAAKAVYIPVDVFHIGVPSNEGYIGEHLGEQVLKSLGRRTADVQHQLELWSLIL